MLSTPTPGERSFDSRCWQALEKNGEDAKGADYARLTAVLIEAIKEQQAQIRSLQKAVEELQSR